MKMVFVGPSLPGALALAAADIVVRPPACQGDVIRAVKEGATAIGLIDGLFERVAPVWHKELLFALSQGIPVLGAASMGALRAAECAAFGMIGIGRIFEDYMSGQRIDDADVALLHGPAELGYPAVTVPIVNIDATLARAFDQGLLSTLESAALAAAARAIFFKNRSWSRVAERAGFDWTRLSPIVEVARVDQKRSDALALMDAIADPALAPLPPGIGSFRQPRFGRGCIRELRQSDEAGFAVNPARRVQRFCNAPATTTCVTIGHYMNMRAIMAGTDTDIHIVDRHQEFLALIRMVGYALDAAKTLGATAAASHIEAARLALVADLQGEFGGLLSSDGISRLAEARAGHC